MFGQPHYKNTHILYHISRRIKIQHSCMGCFTLWASIFGTLGFTMNDDSTGVAAIFSGLLMVVIFSIGFIGVVIPVANYRVRMKIFDDYGEYRGYFYRIKFDWSDAERLAYLPLPKSPAYRQLTLFINNNAEVKSGIFYALVRQFIAQITHYQMSPYHIPVDNLYSKDPLKRSPITRKESQVHFEHFLKTDIGHDLLKHAPHIIKPEFSHVLSDS